MSILIETVPMIHPTKVDREGKPFVQRINSRSVQKMLKLGYTHVPTVEAPPERLNINLSNGTGPNPKNKTETILMEASDVQETATASGDIEADSQEFAPEPIDPTQKPKVGKRKPNIPKGKPLNKA